MQQREGFSARTLALSTAAAELGRVILRAGQSGSVRAALLGNVLAAAALVLLAVFVSWNAACAVRALSATAAAPPSCSGISGSLSARRR